MASDAGRGARDRPPGRAPRGTAWGFGTTMLFWEALPAITLLALSPFAAVPMDVIVVALLSPFASLVILLPLVIGFKSRRYWGVLAYFWCGAGAAALPFLGLALIGTALAVSGHRPEMVGLTYVCAVPLLLALAMLPLLLRALRLRYWQPWTEPGQWEPGDEATPAWLFRAAGKRPPADRRGRPR